MKYTKEDIEKLKNDPIIRLLAIFADKSVDDIIAEVESEYKGDGDLHWSKENGTVPVKDQTKTKKEPLNISGILDSIMLFKETATKLKSVGVDMWNSNIVIHLLDIVFYLLSYTYNECTAGEFLSLIYDDKSSRADFETLLNE